MKAIIRFNQILLIVILLSVLKVHGQFVPDTIALKFKIKTVSVNTFYNGSESPSITEIEYYDSLGHVIQQTSWNNLLNYFPIIEFYYYDIKGRKVKKESTHFNIYNNRTDSTKSIEKYCYNKLGLLESNDFGKIKYKFNKNRQVIEKIEKTAHHYNKKTLYLYNNHNCFITELTYNISGLESKINYNYNNEGKIINKTESYYEGNTKNLKEEYYYEFEYNKLGLLTTVYQNQIVNKDSKKSDKRIKKYVYTFC